MRKREKVPNGAHLDGVTKPGRWHSQCSPPGHANARRIRLHVPPAVLWFVGSRWRPNRSTEDHRGSNRPDPGGSGAEAGRPDGGTARCPAEGGREGLRLRRDVEAGPGASLAAPEPEGP